MHKDLDEKILALLLHNAKTTTGQIAKRTGIPVTTVHNRIKRMEKEGIIKRYVPVLDYTKLGKSIHAMIFINASHAADQEQLAQRFRAMKDVERCQIITGGFDMKIEVRTSTIEELNNIITKDLHRIPGIENTQTMIVLKELE